MENKAETGKSDAARREEAILEFWRTREIFAKTEAKPATKEFVFYDGPPFATGLPHFGHLLPTSLKDAIPRYQTMRGRRVRRRWGWDCHGLPIENIIEAELGFKTKKDIERFGIERFNQAARTAVLRYTDDWARLIPRLGRWVDMENAYRTMDASYTETVWWVFKELHRRGLVSQGYKSMHLCPRCETTLANFEVNQGYRDIEDLAVIVKFPLRHQPDTYLLAWTTTPWTLPGNVALAINPDLPYVKVKTGPDYLIVAADRLEAVFGPGVKGQSVAAAELIGRRYEPPFDYYAAAEIDNRERGWLIYGASFVTTAEGTGIVHIAPAFGEDDYELARREKLPLLVPVGTDGRFKAEVTDWAGLEVKPKDRHQETDKLVIEQLAARDRLFNVARFTHSYPHCWRCDTPLLNYAAISWFVEVSRFKTELTAANQRINWVPEHLKNGRFGKWLEGARDWAISRSRFWGAPLPVWRCDRCQRKEIIGNLTELKSKLPRSRNNYWTIRHGEAISNLDSRISSRPENDDPLSPRGREQVAAAADRLRAENIDLIITSDFRRTRETAELLAACFKLPAAAVINDQRLREIQAGELEGRSWAEYDQFFHQHRHDPGARLPAGESLLDVRARATALLQDCEEKYVGRNILLVSHGLTIFSLWAAGQGVPDEKLTALRTALGPIKQAEPAPVDYWPYPRNETGALDLHRPFIDQVKWPCACGGRHHRVPEVFDCWFESGAMPYGQVHYLGVPRPDFNPAGGIGFPSDFIAEGLDQTRGWFYSLLVLSVALFGRAPYKNVVVNGLVLAEDGQKMSKRLKNYPDPMAIVNRYGADALRFYLLSSPAVRADDFAFSEFDLGNVYRQVVMRLSHVLEFYQTYAADSRSGPATGTVTEHILDRWILARLNQTTDAITEAFEAYEVDRAARAGAEFIDDLSNWYIRRSRERVKATAQRTAALATIRHVLRELAKLLAPLTPFLAEYIFQTLRYQNEPESVHLADWPAAGLVDSDLLAAMAVVRDYATLGLMKRAEAQIRVRQPLLALRLRRPVSPIPYWDQLAPILAEEINVKEIIFDDSLGAADPPAVLNTNLSPELKAEGEVRDLIRQLQAVRKKMGLAPSQPIVIKAGAGGRDWFLSHGAAVQAAVNAKEIVFSDDETGSEELAIGRRKFTATVTPLNG